MGQPIEPREVLGSENLGPFVEWQATGNQRRKIVSNSNSARVFGEHDLPLKFHPAAIRASAGFAPVGAVSFSAYATGV